MGGSVGLKGTDGAETLAAARRRGARPVAPRRAREALEQLAQARAEVELLAYSEPLGAADARAAGLEPLVLRPDLGPPTTAADTRSAAIELAARGVSLLLFAGGDGTAVDVLGAV